MNRQLFEEKKNVLCEEMSLLESRTSRISTLRIVSFLAGIVLLCLGVDKAHVVMICLGVLLLLAFLYLVRMHGMVYERLEKITNKEEVLRRYVARFDEGWREFSDVCDAGNDTVASDIDLLGANSLYQLINVCHTAKGKDTLKKRFALASLSDKEIKLRNKAIEELISKVDFAIEFETGSIGLEDNRKSGNIESFVDSCLAQNIKLPAWAKVVRFLAPVTVALSVVLWILGIFNYGLPLLVFFVWLCFSWLTKSVTDTVIQPLYLIAPLLENYVVMMNCIDKEEFSSDKMKEIKEVISGDKGALRALSSLRGLVQAYNVSFNPLIHQVCSGLFLWDYQLAALVNRWNNSYGENVKNCFEVLGEVEELLSFAVLGMTRETTFATVAEDENSGCGITGEGLYHPLIAPEQVKDNPVNLSSGITIITGSNMSGKTTYLRTVAMNLALAYMGAPICGKKLVANKMKIFTSMRVTDDVAHGISTFYAEILRIKAMAEYRNENLPMICFIDEIFKGTNSADRIVGAKEVIRGLAGKNCIAVVSTHDFELCTIKDEDDHEATNYHFEEYYEDDSLKFDYSIKQGRCTTTNARAILRMAGFDVLDDLN